MGFRAVMLVLSGLTAGGVLSVRSATLAVVANAAPVANIDPINSGWQIERSECLPISLGPSAAAECGSLRVSHQLPATRTFNKLRAPTLIYNSEFAHPWPLVPVLESQLSTTTTPDSVEVVFKVGGVLKATKRWAGSEWAAGQTMARRVTIAYDAFNDATGFYTYEIEVANIYGGARLAAPVQTGLMFLINRKSSFFGAGWSIAGVGKLGTLSPYAYVIEGDGSARHFLSFPLFDPNKYTSLTADGTDSMRFVPATQKYTRYLREGVKIEYDNLGRQTKTIDRFGQTTTFGYAGSTDTLKTITLPAPSGLSYSFTYSGGRLSSVTSPAIGGQTRNTSITNSGGNVSSIQDPGSVAVGFGYYSVPGKQHLMSVRTNRFAVPDSFAYDSAARVTSSKIKMSPDPDIAWSIIPGETRGLPASGSPSSVDTAKVTTRVDGPRPLPTADTTNIYQQRFGAPRRIVDAFGNVTRIFRAKAALDTVESAEYGWLIHRVKRPGGQVLLVNWGLTGQGSFTGNPHWVIDSVTSVAGQRDTTRYTWDPKFDQLVKIDPPMHDSITFGVDTTYGRRLWQQDARGITSRVTFNYDATYAGQVTSMVLPAVNGFTATHSFKYHPTLRNVDTLTTPGGYKTSHTYDAIGRVTATRTPIDANPLSSQRVEQRLTYDLRDLVVGDTRQTLNFTPSEKLRVQNVYDNEGRLLLVFRSSSPDSGFMGGISNSFSYDKAGRVREATGINGQRDSTFY